ncbi:hypothetical protein MUK42_12073, partial [Musa troglodytarum]
TKEGILAQVGLLHPLIALAIILVFFTVVEGNRDGGARDELTLGWIPTGSGYRESIVECLVGDEFDLGTKAPVASSPASPSPPFHLLRWEGGDGFFFF